MINIKIFALLLILFLNGSVYGYDSLNKIKQQIEKVERDISDLQKTVFNNKLNISASDIDNQPINSQLTVLI